MRMFVFAHEMQTHGRKITPSALEQENAQLPAIVVFHTQLTVAKLRHIIVILLVILYMFACAGVMLFGKHLHERHQTQRQGPVTHARTHTPTHTQARTRQGISDQLVLR